MQAIFIALFPRRNRCSTTWTESEQVSIESAPPS